MNYRLVKKDIAVKCPEEEIKFESKKIKKLSGSKDILFFVYEDGIGCVQDNVLNINWHHDLMNYMKFDFTSLKSIAFSEYNQTLYVLAKNGSQIYQIQINDMFVKELFPERISNSFGKRYIKSVDSVDDICVENQSIYFSIEKANRCFHVSSGSPMVALGNGKSGFSISTPIRSQINHPMGITCFNGVLYVSDNGNRCIRGTNGKAIFNVLGDCNDPKQIVFKDNRLFFVTEKRICMLSSEGDSGRIFEVCKTEYDIDGIFPINKKKIYILENINGLQENKTENN